METRWHVPEGKDLAEIKIDDRVKELHASVSKWAAINEHLQRNERAAQALAAEEAKKRALKDGSHAMTQHWPDSKENVDRESLRLSTLQKQPDDQVLVRFTELKKEQDAERKLYVDKMREKIMARRDYPKAVTAAYLLSRCLYENERQIERKRLIKQHQEEEALKFREKFGQEAEQAKAEESKRWENEVKKREKNAEHLMQQINQIKAEKKSQRIRKIEEELVEHDRAQQEMEAMAKRQQAHEAMAKRISNKTLKKFIEIQREEKEKQKEQDIEYEKLSQIVQESRDRIACISKQKEKEAVEQRFAKATGTFSKSGEDKRDADLEIIYQKGQAKMREEEEARIRVEQEKRQKEKEEIEESYKQCLKRKEERKKYENEIKKWEMKNRLAFVEKEKLRKEQEKVEEQKRGAVIKELLDEHLKVKEEKQKAQTIKEFNFDQEKNAAEDAYFFKYAEETTKELEELQMSTYPVKKLMTRYQTEVQNLPKKQPTGCSQALHLADCRHDIKEVVTHEPLRNCQCVAEEASGDCQETSCKCFKNINKIK